mmetsp:Transcript_36595/g.79868  ORF Transcript_36595/g.79868 Transcript_36595/m.79868 type:complete len:235 (-) Transcript_36595:424-1128(-)
MVEHLLRGLQQDVAKQLSSRGVKFLSRAPAQQVEEGIASSLVRLGEVPAPLLPGRQRGEQVCSHCMLLESNSVPQGRMLRSITELGSTEPTFYRRLHHFDVAVAHTAPEFLYCEPQLLRCFRRRLSFIDLLQCWLVRAVGLGSWLCPCRIKIIQANATSDHSLCFVYGACIDWDGIHRTGPSGDVLGRQDGGPGPFQRVWIRGFQLHGAQRLLNPILRTKTLHFLAELLPLLSI